MTQDLICFEDANLGDWVRSLHFLSTSVAFWLYNRTSSHDILSFDFPKSTEFHFSFHLRLSEHSFVLGLRVWGRRVRDQAIVASVSANLPMV